MARRPFKVGDLVQCYQPGSWVHGKIMEIIALDVTSSDESRGHLLQEEGCQTVVGPDCLNLVTTADSRGK